MPKVVEELEATATQKAKKTRAEKRREKRGNKKILKQVESECNRAKKYVEPKWEKWAVNLTLYNNQRRDPEAIGDSLMFTVFQTILASLYEDRLVSTFQARTEGDIQVSENLTTMAKFDFCEMQKDIVDFEWIWDTLFFGRGLLLLMEFDREKKVPVPEVIDPMTFLRDPNASSVNGNRKGKGAARFFGRYIRMTKAEIKKAGVYEYYGKLKPVSGGVNDINDRVDANRTARAEAQGLNNVNHEDLEGGNKEYSMIEWFTTLDGKKCLVTVDPEFKTIVRYQELKNQENWPLIDRSIYPISHDWDGVSIPDLTEDKQRARAILQNLGLSLEKSALYASYLYDNTKITNKADLLNLEQNRFVGVDGPVSGAIQPIPRENVGRGMQYIFELMDQTAQRATATPETKMGALSNESKTATEIGTLMQTVDTRYSLSAKIFGWSERNFWRQWYFLYKNYLGNDIDEKVIRLKSPFGLKFRTLMKDNIKATVDPDVEIESAVIAEAERKAKLKEFYSLYTLIAQESTANRRYAIKKMAQLTGMDTEEIQILLPPTVDEMDAIKENEILNKDKTVEVDLDDDHMSHKEMHMRANPNAATLAHVEAHDKMMLKIKKNPKLVRPELAEKINQLGNRPINPEEMGSMANLNFDTPTTLNTAK